MNKRRRRTQVLAINAITLAIILISTFVSIPGAGAVTVPLTLLAVIVSSVFGGIWSALFSSFAMGITLLIKNFAMPNYLSLLFQHPLVAVLPRVFIGIGVLLTYRLAKLIAVRVQERLRHRALLKDKTFISNRAMDDIADTVALTVGGMVAPVINTGLVFLMIWLVFANQSLQTPGFERTVEVNGALFTSLLTINFVIEIVACSLLSAPILMALKKAFKVSYYKPKEKAIAQNTDTPDTENIENDVF